MIEISQKKKITINELHRMILELAGEMKSVEWRIKWASEMESNIKKDFERLKADCKSYIQDNAMLKTRMRLLEERLKIVENQSEKRYLQDTRDYIAIKHD